MKKVILFNHQVYFVRCVLCLSCVICSPPSGIQTIPDFTAYSLEQCSPIKFSVVMEILSPFPGLLKYN